HQEFAAPGKFKEKFCKGRLCANCGKCRDWHYTGDASSWRWLRTANNNGWRDYDVKRWSNGKYWEKFERRTDG
ncbi:unnamed protein product, partial [Rotaria sp. Silwood2]